MTTAIVYSDHFREHATGSGHPERPERLAAIIDQLQQDDLWQKLHHLSFEGASLKWIQRTHALPYVRRLHDACQNGASFIDVPDSTIGHRSYDVALLAVGGVLAAADAVVNQTVRNAFCAVRPPGHHAETDRSMGFCLFNNVAIAANYLIARHALDRIAIVDFDAHHGNGTQHIFESRQNVLYVSLHQDPVNFYPGTGFSQETGSGPGKGYTLNLPLSPGSGDEVYRQLFLQRVLPTLATFKPDCILISAGFDAATEDPLAQLNVTEAGFFWITEQLVTAANELCRGRLISILEGGYDLESLAQNVSRHIRSLRSMK